MPLIATGLNHHTASVALREQVAFTDGDLAEALTDARAVVPGLQEIAILSTCNRTELYAVLADDDDDGEALAGWLAGSRGIATDQIAANRFGLWDDDAVRHLSRVASGLDSQVLGEPQILGQFKEAFEQARRSGTIGPTLDELARHTLGIAKRVRTDTELGRNPISVAFAAVSLAERIFADLGETQALLLGAGDTIELVARHLKERGVGRMVIANRTLANAETLARTLGAEPAQLSDAPAHLAHSDIVISSTGSALPVLGKGAVEAALRLRKRRPIFMVDIAVPRDIEPQVAQLTDVYLYTVDDLGEIIADNMRARREAAKQAEQLVTEGIEQYQRQRRIRGQGDTVRALRGHAMQIRDAELARALKDLEKGADPAQVLTRLASGLTNKLLHKPTVALREAGASERHEVIQLVADLYELDRR